MIRIVRNSTFIFLLLLFHVFALKADTEPNNNQANANFIATNGSENGFLNGSDVQDWYYFITNGDGNVSVTAAFSSGLTGTVTLVTPDAAALASSNPSSGTVTISRTCLTSDTLYILVQRSANSGTYTVSNSWSEITIGNDQEPNDDIASAVSLFEGALTTGHLGYVTFTGVTGTTDSRDYYQIITDGGDVSVAATFSSGLTGYIRLLTEDNGNIGTSATASGSLSLSVSCLAADTFYIQVFRTSGCGGYDLNFQNISTVIANDVEPNNASNEALTLVDGQPAQGSLGYISYDNNVGTTDQIDWYVFSIPSSDSLKLEVNFESTLTGNIRLLSKASFVLQTSPTGTGNLSISFNCLSADTFYVRVTRVSGCGDYSLELDAVSSGNPEDNEPNDLSSQAIFTGSNSSNAGTLGYISFVGGTGITDIVDWYRFALPEDGSVDVSATFGGSLTGSISIRTKNNGVLQSSATGSGPFSVSTDCLASDTFLIAVLRSGGCGDYTLDIQTTSSLLTNDVEPNNSMNEAWEITSSTGVTGHLGYVAYNGFTGTTDNSDWYRLILPEDGKVVIAADFEGTVTGRFDLITDANALLKSSANGSGLIVDSFDCLASDTFFIRVVWLSGCGGYSLTYDGILELLNNDPEPNNAFVDANSILLNTSYTGHIGYVAFSGLTASTDQVDFYSFNIASPGDYSIAAAIDSSTTGRLVLSNGNQAFLSQTANGTGQLVLNYSFTSAGSYFVRILRTAANTCGSYQFAIAPAALLCDSVSNLSTSNLSTTSVTLNWDANPDADHYEIRGGLAGSNPANYITLNIPSGSTDFFNVSGLVSGTSYEWQIRSHCDPAETLTSDWSALNVFTTLSCIAPSPANTSLITTSSARLNWTPVAGVVGYEILGRQAGSSVIVTLNINNPSASFFDVIGLPGNTTYEWAARSVCSGGLRSGFTNIQTFTTLSSPEKMQEDNISTVELYPNPAADKMYVNINAPSFDEVTSVIIYDLAGRAVFQKLLNPVALNEISVEKLQNGFYVMVILRGNEFWQRSKFQVAK